MQRAPSQSLPGKLEVRSGNQKKEKITLGVTISPHPQRTPLYVAYTFRFVHVGWGHRRNDPGQVSSQSVQQFRLPRGSKFTISHRLGEWLIQQCYALTCYTVIIDNIALLLNVNFTCSPALTRKLTHGPAWSSSDFLITSSTFYC